VVAVVEMLIPLMQVATLAQAVVVTEFHQLKAREDL